QAVIGVLLQPGGTAASHIKIDDIDVIPDVPGNFTGSGPGDLRPPFHVRNVGNASGRRAAGGDGPLRRAPRVIPRSEVGDIARSEELRSEERRVGTEGQPRGWHALCTNN